MKNNKFKVGDVVYTRKVIEFKVGGCLPMGTSLTVTEVGEGNRITCAKMNLVNGLNKPIIYALTNGDVKKGC